MIQILSPLPTGKSFEVFFDGDCPLCKREIELIRRFDSQKNLLFTDIASADFDASKLNLDMTKLMASIHGRMADGQVIEGVEVFRQLYGAIGLKWLMPITRLPGIRHALDGAYKVFAKNRLRLTGRCDDNCKIEPNRVQT